jgi:hypothetical protein
MADTISKAVVTAVAPEVDKSNWEWVEVPELDSFGTPHSGVSVNFEQFRPGRHFLAPELAFTVKDLLLKKLRADQRVFQKNTDQVALRLMQKNGPQKKG